MARDSHASAADTGDRTALQLASSAANRSAKQASYALQRNWVLGLLATSACAVACTSIVFSTLAYVAVNDHIDSLEPEADTAAETIPDGATAADIAEDPIAETLLGRGYSTATPTTSYRIAVGSRYQPGWPASQAVWSSTVLPAAPDAWIWAGNMAFFDGTALDCSAAENSGQSECACNTATTPADNLCATATTAKAWRQAALLLQSGYTDLLDLMCPGAGVDSGSVPSGVDPEVCPKPVLGIYGTHDSFGALADRTFAQKSDIKHIHLDLMGEGQTSAARSRIRGAFARKRIFEDAALRNSVDVYLLDEHFDRAPVPCGTVAAACTEHPDTAFCRGVDDGSSICCGADDMFANDWCTLASSAADSNFAAICSPESSEFGQRNFDIDAATNASIDASPDSWAGFQEPAAFCDVLGGMQRSWLARELAASDATVNLVVAPGGLLGNPEGDNGGCSGTEWDCYRPAQVHLLHTLANATGCTIVLAGDSPLADFKVVRSGSILPYASHYAAAALKKSVYQVSTPALSPAAARPVLSSCGAPCCGSDLDESMLRIGGSCATTSTPGLAIMDIDWSVREARVQIVAADGSGTLSSVDSDDPVTLDFTLDLQMCLDG